LSKYRRIEINAYHRNVTVVSGEWRPADLFDRQPTQTKDEVSLNDTDTCEPVAPDSPEGQLILVEAVRSLEQRLSPDARALISAGHTDLTPRRSMLKRFCLRLRSFFRANTLPSLDENPAVKQSVKTDSADLVADGWLQPSRHEE
jgi:hypothetical protein